jgi:hypothetical protein
VAARVPATSSGQRYEFLSVCRQFEVLGLTNTSAAAAQFLHEAAGMTAPATGGGTKGSSSSSSSSSSNNKDGDESGDGKTSLLSITAALTKRGRSMDRESAVAQKNDVRVRRELAQFAWVRFRLLAVCFLFVLAIR